MEKRKNQAGNERKINVASPFTQQRLCRPESIVKRIFARSRHDTILTPNFFHEQFCMATVYL